MANLDKIIEAWNAQADKYNQWSDLGEDEKLEWAVSMVRKPYVTKIKKLENEITELKEKIFRDTYRLRGS